MAEALGLTAAAATASAAIGYIDASPTLRPLASRLLGAPGSVILIGGGITAGFIGWLANRTHTRKPGDDDDDDDDDDPGFAALLTGLSGWTALDEALRPAIASRALFCAAWLSGLAFVGLRQLTAGPAPPAKRGDDDDAGDDDADEADADGANDGDDAADAETAVGARLVELGLGATLPAFRAAGLLGDDLTLITELGNDDLDKLGVRLGDRRRLRQAFEARGDGSS